MSIEYLAVKKILIHLLMMYIKFSTMKDDASNEWMLVAQIQHILQYQTHCKIFNDSMEHGIKVK